MIGAPPSIGLPGPLRTRPSSLGRDVDLGDLLEEADLGLVDVDALRALEDLDDGDVAARSRGPARCARSPSGIVIATISLYATRSDVLDEESGPVT